MKHTLFCFCLAAALVLLASCAPTPEPEATVEEDIGPTIEGVWEIEEVEVIGGPDEGTIVPQASLVIFTKQYYSSMRVETPEPRALFKTRTPSESEIVEAFNSFDADSGTYEFDGSALVLHPSVAKGPNMMAGGSASFDCQLEGDTVTAIIKPDQLVVPGIEYTPSDFTEACYKLRRLE